MGKRRDPMLYVNICIMGSGCIGTPLPEWQLVVVATANDDSFIPHQMAARDSLDDLSEPVYAFGEAQFFVFSFSEILEFSL